MHRELGVGKLVRSSLISRTPPLMWTGVDGTDLRELPELVVLQALVTLPRRRVQPRQDVPVPRG